jgi:hypothetical protein
LLLLPLPVSFCLLPVHLHLPMDLPLSIFYNKISLEKYLCSRLLFYTTVGEATTLHYIYIIHIIVGDLLARVLGPQYDKEKQATKSKASKKVTNKRKTERLQKARSITWVASARLLRTT